MKPSNENNPFYRVYWQSYSRLVVQLICLLKPER